MVLAARLGACSAQPNSHPKTTVPGEAGMCHGLVGGWSLSIRELGHRHIPVTLKVWPHHQCSASPSALVWAAQTASVRASSCAMLCSSCCSQAARASVATPRHVLLALSALSDPGQWGMSGERAVLV